MASSVSRLIVKPAASIRNTAPTSEIGIATTGISTARNDPRNRKITTTTISSVSLSVFSTSSIASWMYAVASYGMPARMPAGSCASMPFISVRTLPITSSALAEGSTQMPMKVAAWPSKRTSSS